MRRAERAAGFTMVEMMVVLAVIGILAMIGVPSLIGVMPRIRLNNETMILSNEIAVARMRAIAKSTQFRIVFDTAADTYRLDVANGAVWDEFATSHVAGTDLYSVAGFDPVSAGPLVASGNGQMNVPLNTQAVIELRTLTGDFRKRIYVEPTGRMYVKRASPAGAWVDD